MKEPTNRSHPIGQRVKLLCVSWCSCVCVCVEETSPRCGVCMCVSVNECVHVFVVFACVFVVFQMCAVSLCERDTQTHQHTMHTFCVCVDERVCGVCTCVCVENVSFCVDETNKHTHTHHTHTQTHIFPVFWCLCGSRCVLQCMLQRVAVCVAVHVTACCSVC